MLDSRDLRQYFAASTGGKVNLDLLLSSDYAIIRDVHIYTMIESAYVNKFFLQLNQKFHFHFHFFHSLHKLCALNEQQ